MSAAAASEAPPSSMSGGLGGNPIDGVKRANNDLVSWLYKSHGAAVDEQLRKLDQAGVKREHIVYGLIGLLSLYLIFGEEAFFLSVLITFTYPAWNSIQTLRSRNGGEALSQLLYWINFGFFTLLDSSAVSLAPTYYLLKTAFLVFLFLPHTQGAQLIYQKAIEPLAKTIDGFVKKK
ncbi:TB2/DP1, HVA22 family [Dictyocaulus viviparus]|uniref:Receptor expression-enhancing protein n=1 Tax=Dictyocaulus viviparus TaxID=29172 RepID=A0A0D8Y949_DICVI|nr:TB2/DP1, HVA22 family [Dictyocaulus viviparus]